MNFEVSKRVVLPRQALPQPKPAIGKGGDCSACVLGGLLGWDSVQKVYDEIYTGVDSENNWYNQKQLLERLDLENELEHVVIDTPIWPGTWQGSWTWGLTSGDMRTSWWAYLKMALDGGYYGIASVDYAKGGPTTDTDHVVLLCGAREVTKPHPRVAGATFTELEIFVSCSAGHPSGKWVEVKEFLTKWGGFHMFLAKPKEGSSNA